MKNLFVLLLCGLLLLCVGCAWMQQEEPETEPMYDLYFRVANLNDAAGADAIASQWSDIAMNTESEAEALAEQLMLSLLKGPNDLRLCSPFPRDTVLRSVRIFGGRATVDLSLAYATLSGVELAMADYCITLTLTQIPEIRSVQTTVNGGLLAYRSSQNFTACDVLISSAEDVVATVDVMLYFCDRNGFLVNEKRTLELYEGDTRAEALVEALSHGPKSPEAFSPFPDGFAVQSVWIKDEVCYVNVSSVMLRSLPPEISTVLPTQTLRRSLLSLENVREVRFLVDGEEVVNLDSVRDLSPVEESGV
jgi:germination protein M